MNCIWKEVTLDWHQCTLYTHTHIHTSHSQRTGAYGGKRAIRFFRCKSCRNGKIHINFPEIRSFLIDFNGYTCIARALRAFIRASGSNSNLIYSCTSIRFEFISNTFYFQLKLKCCERPAVQAAIQKPSTCPLFCLQRSISAELNVIFSRHLSWQAVVVFICVCIFIRPWSIWLLCIFK